MAGITSRYPKVSKWPYAVSKMTSDDLDDGQLSVEELGAPAAPGQPEGSFPPGVDKNNDGSLSVEEFIAGGMKRFQSIGGSKLGISHCINFPNNKQQQKISNTFSS